MPWDEKQRSLLVDRLNEISLELSVRFMQNTSEQRVAFGDEQEALIKEYAKDMPYFTFSRCPICSQICSFVFDPYGLDGPWWWKNSWTQFPPHEVCDHFLFFAGALDLQDRVPSEVRKAVIPGPARPFVINRFMNMDSVQAVIMSRTLQTGDIAYIITYFSSTPIDSRYLHQEWRTTYHAVLDEHGEPVASDTKHDRWNYVLKPWIKQGKLHWIAPNDDECVLQSGWWPHLDTLTGTFAKQTIQYGKIKLSSAPSGQDDARYARD